MIRQWTFFMVVFGVLCASPLFGIEISRGGKAVAALVLAPDASLPEQTAARELADYLAKVTGAEFRIVSEPSASGDAPRVFVGPTQFAKANGVDAAALGAEEWVVRSAGNDLILAGGRPRGTVYAVYRLLEDIVGVHWWSPWAEQVPRIPSLTIENVDRRGKPVFRYRDIYSLYGNDDGRFAARNRLNRDGDTPIAKEYGGCMDYGPPYHVHTFNLYFPPEKFFDQHPEWYSLIKGKRTGDHAQLCLTNPELRKAFLEKLRACILSSREAAEKAGLPAPQVFSISQNDWSGMCECEACQAIAKAEDSEAGPLLDFVNAMADGIKAECPDVFIDTLAYMMTQKAPKTIRPHDNVIIRLCDTHSNFTKPITAPENAAFREHLMSWAAIAKNLRVWDYAVSYAPYYGLPLPTVHTYPVDYRFYAEHNVEGVLTEHEYPILADLRDFKIWMMMKLLEDPYRDYTGLVRTFTDGFYGPAGAQVREYLKRLEAASEAKVSYLSMGASPHQYRYLDLDFVRSAQETFDEAEKAVGGDPVLLPRVRHARLPLDRASVVCYPRLVKQWVAAGNPPETMPLDRDAIARRYKETWYAEIARRIPEKRRAAATAEADEEVAGLTAVPKHLPLPEKFRSLPPAAVSDYPANASRNWKKIVKTVPDAEAESGVTNRLEFPTQVEPEKHPLDKYLLPMPWGLYDQLNKKGIGSGTITPEDVPGPGYHWYKMGSFAVVPSTYLYFFWSWIIQVDIDDVADLGQPTNRFDIWARIKFEGPAFPHGRPDQKNAICVERVILVKSEGG